MTVATAQCLHELIEAQVLRTPDAIAAACGDQQLTYAGLNARANATAHRLVELDVGPERRVGVYLTHSVDLPVTLLAVLKAGGAYLPLDPGFPPERVQQALDDANVTAVVTTAALSARLPPTPARILWLEDVQPPHSGESQIGLGHRASIDNLAYVMYTSGSTGRPKGVLIPHRSVVEGYFAWEEAYRLRTDVRVHSQMGSFAFGVFHLDFVRALCSGAKLVLCEPSVVTDPPRLYGVMTRHRVDFAEFVPAALRGLVRHCRATGRSLAFLNTLIVGSDRWYMAEHRALRMLCQPGARIIHSFGLTETGDTAYFEGSQLDLPGGQLVPIGRPFPNIHAYLLDQHLNPVPNGHAGELFIGGSGIARGISNRPDLTAEKFVPDPFADRAGARMYRTGDQARMLSDGNIEFLGRLDQMVKIRGFRVEPGEVEVVLKDHPAVADCVVVPRADQSGATGLVAYVVPQDGNAATVTELRAHVQARLPEYMMPASFVRLDRLPLTPSGKVDRLALPAPGRSRPDLAQAYTAPRDVQEAAVARVFAETLDLDQVGAEDSFFELGGHSLLAAMAASRLAEILHVDLSVRDIFDFPNVARLAERIVSLAPAGADASPGPARQPRSERSLPLSFAQQRLWFLDQLEPQSSLYNELDAQRLSGELDLEALNLTLGELQRRHEILRTTFELADGQPQQVIGRVVQLPLKVVDLSRETDRERAAFDYVLAEGQRPFDLSKGPLLRASLLTFGPHEHWLLLAMHHIITDAQSMEVLKRELQVIYTAFATGEPSPLPELPLQYADFAIWQRERLQGTLLHRELSYWKAQLEGAPDVAALPTDRPRPRVQSHRGTTQRRLLPPGLPAALRELGQREGATLFMTMLAAFFVLLHRYTGERDLVVGSPVANRTRPELEELLGFFVNTLVLHTIVPGGESFTELLRRVRDVTIDAYEHQELPLEKLVEELRPGRALSHNPLFQVFFSHQLAADPLPVPAWMPFSWMAKFDLALFVREAQDAIGLVCEYSTDLFDDATVSRLLDNLVVLLEAVVAKPRQPVADLALLTPEERSRLLLDWNETAAEFPREACIHELFEIQARHTPDALAVRHQDMTLTYRELNRRANQLAHHLRELGVGPDVPVGLCIERSPSLVVAMLGVLKAGGAYLPLDARYPRERLNFMLAEARSPVLITQTPLLTSLPEVDGRIVCLDRDATMIGGRPHVEPHTDIGSENLAYIIYTSGSTGTPKGVAMPHRPLVNLIAWQTRRSDLARPAATLQFATLSFDVAFQEIFSALLSGGSVAMVDDEQRRDPRQLAKHIAAQRVERLFIPVAMLHQLAELSPTEQQQLRSVRQIITAGEQLQVTEAVRTLFERLPTTTLHNHYGPAETHVVTAHTLGGSPGDWPSAPPIGRPIANARTYVLDERLEPVPIGVAGDLYLGGDSVSRGYLRRPDLTADRFLPDPFPPVIGARMYRTGDRARFLADRTLEFLGRLDNQVKIRGYRIELGEIEAILAQHPGVQKCAVVVRMSDGDRRLVAYVTLASGSNPTVADLRRFLRERLPDYMVPSVVMVLDRLPMTPSGKVDRRALPAPDQHRPELEDAFVRPASAVEREIAEVWSSVLGVEQVGVNDNFFDLGGHSLLATLVVSRLRSRLVVDLGVRDLFESPTVKELASRVQALASITPADEPPLVRSEPASHLEEVARGPDGTSGPLPVTLAQERVWFLHHLRPDLGLYNVFDLHPIAGPLDHAAMAKSLTEVCRRHEPLRTTFELVNGRPMQRIHPPTAILLEVVDLSHEAEPEAAASAYGDQEGQRPFDLVRGPLFRAALLRLSPEQHQLLLTLHHIITDGWSMSVLWRELQTLYDAFSAGRPSPLEELPIRYIDYVAWQQERLKGRRFAQDLAYWKQQLQGAPYEVQLGADHPRPLVPGHRGASQSRLVSARLTEQLLALGQPQGASLFMVLLAAHNALLYLNSGERDLVVGIAVANRSRPELEGIVGLFANLLALRMQVSGTDTFRQLLDRVRAVTLAAYEHQELPFEKVIKALRPERARRFNPLFNVVVAHNALEPTTEAPGAAVASVAGEGHDSRIVPSPSRYDLVLATVPAPQGFRIAIDYNYDLFSDAIATRFLDDLMALLGGVVADPLQTIEHLPVAAVGVADT